jgi:hypothetical protein
LPEHSTATSTPGRAECLAPDGAVVSNRVSNQPRISDG